MSKIKVGQVWKQENGEIFVITFMEKHDEDAFSTSKTYIYQRIQGIGVN